MDALDGLSFALRQRGVEAGPTWRGADPDGRDRLAELGVVLLLFTIGLEFSVNDLKKLKKIVKHYFIITKFGVI